MLTVLYSVFPKRSGRIRLLLCHGQPDLIFLTAKSLMIELRTSKWKPARWLKLLLLKQWEILNLPKSVPMQQPQSPSAAHKKRWDAASSTWLQASRYQEGGMGQGADLRRGRWWFRQNRRQPSVLLPCSVRCFALEGGKESQQEITQLNGHCLFCDCFEHKELVLPCVLKANKAIFFFAIYSNFWV